MAHQLNPAQREAVHTPSGPMLVLAGAGTGKTRVVTFRIAQLIRQGVPPERILAVTFTNKASKEMQQRASELLGKRLPKKPEISTFHSLCVRILRRNIQQLGYPSQFAIYDRGDQESLARAALREIKVPNETLRPGDLLNQISRWKVMSLRPRQAGATARTDKEHLAAMAYRRYQAALQAAGAVDFDDLLLLTEELFERFDETRRQEAARFDHLLVDEYQDTNGSQYRIVKALAERHRNLCVVGDDDQSIYAWRGAEVAHILRFAKDWPDAKVVRLEENYRSTAPILGIANRLIAYNRQRHVKVLRAFRQGGENPRIWQLPDEMAEAKEVVDEIKHLTTESDAQPRDFAILFRTNEQPRGFEAELRRQRVPYVLVGGMSFYDRKEVRDVLAYLKVLANPQDEVSLLRIINTPPRGIGQGTVQQMLQQAVAESRSLWNEMQHLVAHQALAPAVVTAVGRFLALIEEYRGRLESESLVDVVSQLIRAVDYRQELRRIYKEETEQESRWNSVEELINAVGEYVKRSKRRATLDGFLEEVALVGREDERDKEASLERNAVALMTLHSAKGLEFPQVYLVGLEEGLLPHRRSIEMEGDAIDEERRLCYVGVTRAQDRLTITWSLTRMKWGKSRPTVPSRFLFEINGQADRPSALPTPAHPAGRPNPKAKSGPVKKRPPARKPSTNPSGGQASRRASSSRSRRRPPS